MKGLLLFLSIIATTISVKGQGYGHRYDSDVYPITIGIMGTGTYSSLRLSSSGATINNQKGKFTGSFGLNIDFRLSDNFSLRSGLMYAGKGGGSLVTYSDPTSGLSIDVNNSFSLNYLEVPLNFLFHVPIGGGDASVYFGGGPFIGYGLNGKNTQSIGPLSASQNVYFGSGGDFSKNDYGATAVLGYQAESGLSISLNSDIGFKNILLTDNSGAGLTGAKTLLFYLTVGKSF